jgi:peptidoglycan/LPS O-acetylase OafA/YrhL
MLGHLPSRPAAAALACGRNDWQLECTFRHGCVFARRLAARATVAKTIEMQSAEAVRVKGADVSLAPLVVPPPAVHTAPNPRIRTLDGLRAFSIVLVIVGHLAGNPVIPPAVADALDFANFGVRIFFVISGFLITTLLLKELAKTGTISLKNFYLRRVFRIFPAFYTYFLVIAAASFAGLIVVPKADLLAAACYVMNYRFHPSWYVGHIWSLSVEEQFYLMWPFALALAGRRWATRIAVAVFLAAPAFRIGIFYLEPAWRPGIGSIFPTIADALAVGCFLALRRDWLWEKAWYRKLLQSRWFFLVPVGALLANKLSGSVRLYILLVLTLMNLAVAASIDWSMRNADSWVGKILELKPVAFVGVLSYSLYLWQQPFFDYRGGVQYPIIFSLAASLALALASYNLIEKPFLRMKDRFFPSA